MPLPIEEQVIEFYYDLFDRIFTQPFSRGITQRLKRDAVKRQVEESAGAASQSLTLFFNTQETPDNIAADILQSCAAIPDFVKLEDIANPNVPPETLVDQLLGKLPGASELQETEQGAVYRVVLHSVLQVLMLVGPVMKEWQKLSFAGTFELNRQIINRLNQISEQLDVLGQSGEAAADEGYELTYRDYLLQRFHRVEAGTVRMTTNLAVDLGELFVMPQVRVRPKRKKDPRRSGGAGTELMTLAAARKIFAETPGSKQTGDDIEREAKPIDGLEFARKQQRCVIVGAPGAGKSTFLEWLQLRVAGVEEELPLGDQQAIPLLLRLRQLDPMNLPNGPALIEKATASKDRAALMPDGWVDRQMRAGRVLFMLDGIDEVEPELRDRRVLPWLVDLCKKYPKCAYLLSSRPVGYPPGTLDVLGFAECDLLDFSDEQIAAYTRHWCTAIRLARNEPREEARTEGEKDGDSIVQSFKGHAYISGNSGFVVREHGFGPAPLLDSVDAAIPEAQRFRARMGPRCASVHGGAEGRAGDAPLLPKWLITMDLRQKNRFNECKECGCESASNHTGTDLVFSCRFG